MSDDPIRGRGAAENPPNRFERLHYEPDPEANSEDLPSPKTELLKDATRTILATNDSPDVGFKYSLNPYRGCEHGCAYCTDPETPILLATGATKPIAELKVGDEIYGTERRGWYRRYVRTRVLAHWETQKVSYRVVLADGTELIASGDHRFLTERGWKFVRDGERCQRPHLTVHNKLMGTGAFARARESTDEYRRGYLAGMIRGDGLLRSYEYERTGRSYERRHHFRLALADTEALDRSEVYLAAAGVGTHRFAFAAATERRRAMLAIRTQAESSVARIRGIVQWPLDPSDEWSRGFLAGIFDAEGSFSGCLRISNTDSAIVDAIERSLLRFGFRLVVERIERERPISVVRLLGGLREQLRFFHLVGPAISRKLSIDGLAIKSDADLSVTAVEPLGVRTLVDITTGTGDFIANGVVSHNCFARPTHEYLGFSAGLDFETKILVKEDAPELLRKELSSRRWVPQTVMVTGVTDAWQPIERTLRLTRRCLEVFVEFRNPVATISKNELMARDADLLGELAKHRAAGSALSITTLDPALARILEPRASVPERRLAAIRALSDAGVPCTVMVAPVIPGLTDHEMPSILAAAKDAGATSAGFVMLRLPGAVAPLFVAWLERHFPDRKDKIL
ncbi:MAG TPA: radical SAM protein, partial [Thermoanaerobaculia bacterium]|nr:radical SAM protein [Thermoanaerobaculia bacterium]